MARKPGQGSLWQRGTIWWCKYYVSGRPVRESTGAEKEEEAQQFLNKRLGRVAEGQPILPKADRVRYEEIAADLRRHYEVTGSRNLREADVRLRPLLTFFKGRRIVAIGGAEIEKYVELRQAAGVTNGAINRELATLGKMLRVAYENGKVLRLPVIHRLKEASPRHGFFEPEQFKAVRRWLPEDLQVAVTIAYTFGWRMQSEVLSLALSQLDLETGTLRLETGTTKNGEGRLVYLTPEIQAMLTAQVERVKVLSRKLHRVIPCLFPNLKGPHEGDRRHDFRKTWATALKRVGLVGMLRHDFRRTAVRNLVNNGIPERVAMKITGHKTRAVFDRYHIVSPADLQEAARKMTGTNTGTVGLSAVDLGS